MAALDIYVLSFEAHFRLVTIHPWSDGNGRVARLVMNLVQMEGEVAPTIVRSDHKVRYIESLRASQEAGTPEPFLDFMTDELIDALAHDIDEYEHDLSRDVPWETFDPSTEPRSTPQVRRLISVLGDRVLSASEMRETPHLSDARASGSSIYVRRSIAA